MVVEKRARDSQRGKLYRWGWDTLEVSGVDKHLTAKQGQTLVYNAIAWWFKLDKNQTALLKNGYSAKLPSPLHRSRSEKAKGKMGGLRNVNSPDFRIKKAGSTTAHASNYEIAIPAQRNSVAVILHETAHFICGRWGVQRADGVHGPIFARVLIELLKRFGKRDRDQMERDAKKYKVKVAPRSRILRPQRVQK